MEMQAVITNTVIDRGLRFSQCAEMLTHDEIRDELIRQIDAGKQKQAEVARHLCIAPARVQEIRKGTRRVQQDEMPKLAVLLGMKEAERNFRAVESVSLIPNWGKVAQGVWLEQSEFDQGETVPYDRSAGDAPPVDLFAVTPEGTSMNLRFMPGTRLICRKVQFASGSFRPGDYVIAERTAHDLVELTVKRLEIDDDGAYWLHSESSDKRFQEPWLIGKPEETGDDTEVRVVGKVIRAVQDFENV